MKKIISEKTKQIVDLTNKANLDLMFELPNEKLEKFVITVRREFNTACWTFKKFFRPPHIIQIGDTIFEGKNDICKNDDLKQGKIKSLIVHELAHAKYTERDFTKINKILKETEVEININGENKTVTIPFSLFNIFEDAKIEFKQRETSPYKFQWDKYESFTLEDTSNIDKPLEDGQKAVRLLFAFIILENDFVRIFDLVKKTTDSFFKDNLDTVKNFYNRTVSTNTFEELVPIMAEWLKKYPLPPEEGKGQGVGLGDLQEQLSEEEFANLCESLVTLGMKNFNDVQEVKDQLNLSIKVKNQWEGDDAECSNGVLLSDTEVRKVDNKRASTLVNKLMKVLKGTETMFYSDTPSKKFSAKRAILEKQDVYKKIKNGINKKKTIALIVDTSGSMGATLPNGETHISEGVVLINALSMLAKAGLVEGFILLSGVPHKPKYQKLSLPLKESDMNKIDASNGSEGLGFTMEKNINLLKKVKNVLVYTDAQICDKPVDKELLHKHGIKTIGCYVGTNESYMDDLQNYFDKCCMRESIEELTDAMLNQLM